MASSASSSSRRKHIMHPGPITINIADGTPFGPYYHSFITRISSHVTHSDEFPPSQTWPQHKKAGRVEALYRDLTAAYSLPSWNDSSDMAARFRQWFNESARHKWNDHKNRSLRRTYDLCKGDVTQASSHQPSTVDADTWTSLLSTYSQNHTVDESGFSKSAKCKASRTCNELDHRLGRESLGSWKGAFRRDRGREPRAVEIFNKEFTKQDPLLASEGNLPPPHMRGKPVSERTFEIGEQLKLAYEAAIASGSDESTATAQAAATAFGRVSKLGLRPSRARGMRHPRRDASYVQLEQQNAQLEQQRLADQERIASLEARTQQLTQTCQEMKDFMARMMSQGGPSGGATPGRGEEQVAGQEGEEQGEDQEDEEQGEDQEDEEQGDDEEEGDDEEDEEQEDEEYFSDDYMDQGQGVDYLREFSPAPDD